MEYIYPYDKEFGGNVLRTDYSQDIGNYRSYLFNKKGTEAMCWALKRQDEKKADEVLEMIERENDVLVDWNIIAGCAVEYNNMGIYNYVANKNLITDWNFILVHAARAGNMPWVSKAIQNGARDMNAGLEYAAEGGDEKVVQYFIRNNNNVIWTRGLIGAAKGGHLVLVKYFSERVNKEEYARPIFVALQKDKENVFDFLVENFPDVRKLHKEQFYFSLGMSLNKYLIDNYIGDGQNDEIIKGLAYKGDHSIIPPLLTISEDIGLDLLAAGTGAGMRGDPVYIDQILEMDKKFSSEEDQQVVIATIVNAAIEANNVGVVEKYLPSISDDHRHIIDDSVYPGKNPERMVKLLEKYNYSGIIASKPIIESGNIELVKNLVQNDKYITTQNLLFYISQAANLSMTEIFVFLVKFGRTTPKRENLSPPVLRRYNHHADEDAKTEIYEYEVPNPQDLPVPNFQISPQPSQFSNSGGIIEYPEPPEVGSFPSPPPAASLPLPNFQDSPVNFSFPSPLDGKQRERKTRENKRNSPPEEIVRKPLNYYQQESYGDHSDLLLEDKDIMSLYDKFFSIHYTSQPNTFYAELLLKTVKDVYPLNPFFLRKKMVQVLKLFSKFTYGEHVSEDNKNYHIVFTLYHNQDVMYEYLRILCKQGPYHNIGYYIEAAIDYDLDNIAKHLMKYRLDFRPTDVNPEEAYKQNY